MSEQQTEDMSMTEILHSIKKFVSGEDQEARPSGQDSDFIRLAPTFQSETQPPLEPEHSSPELPSFIQRAKDSEQTPSTETPNSSASEEPSKTEQILQSFAQQLEQLAPRQQSSESLDQFVQVLLRQSIHDWLDRHLPSLVERIVTQEVQRLAQTILSKNAPSHFM